MNTKLTTLTVLALAVAGLSAAAIAQEPGYGKGPGGEGRHGMMQRIDADGDGVITLEEFSAPRMARFAARDTDGNGVIEGDELAQRGEGPRRQRLHQQP